MKIKWMIYSVSTLILIGIFLAVLWVRHHRHSAPGDAELSMAGRLEVQGVADLGPILIGTMVPASIKIANHGSEDVVINHLKPDCSCTEVYTEHNGAKAKVNDLLIKSNTSETLRLDIKVSGEPGLKLISSLRFQEADRDVFYDPKITYTPVARFYTIPSLVLFGQLSAGEVRTRRIELRSDGNLRRDLDKLTMRSSPQFSMQFLRVSDADRAADPLKGQDLLGFVDLSCSLQGEERNVREELAFVSEGEVLGSVFTSASLTSDLSIVPKILVLPRYGSGKSSYSGWFLCRSHSEKPFTIVPEGRSDDFKVVVDQPDAQRPSYYRIGFTFLGPPPEASTRTLDLSFKVKDESGERPLTTRVLIGPIER